MKRGSNGGLGRDFSWRRKTLTWPNEWGPHVSEIREK
jgi:hypothetical protein